MMLKPNRSSALLLVGSLFAYAGCQNRAISSFEIASSPRAAHYCVSDVRSTDIQFVNALTKLGPVSEEPSFWNEIANSTKYSTSRRQRAVFQLFYRHVRVNVTLEELSTILGTPQWLENDKINEVGILVGLIPVKQNESDTIITLGVLPESGKDHSSIYLRISGKVPLEVVRRVLRGLPSSTDEPIGKAKVLEIGFNDLTFTRH